MGTGASRPGDLVGLLSALQASLFFWCRRHITVLAGEGRKQVAGLVVECKWLDSCNTAGEGWLTAALSLLLQTQRSWWPTVCQC